MELGSSCDTLTSAPGAAPEQVAELLSEARRLQLSVVGLALGLDCTGQEEELTVVKEAVVHARQVVEQADSYGHTMTELHLGQLCLAGTALSPTFTKGVQAVLALVADMEVVADSSHWLVAPSVTLAVRILAVRPRKEATIQYYINEGVFGAFSGVLAGVAGPAMPLPLGGGRNRPGLTARLLEAQILGPSGDELDTVAEDVLLPCMSEEDWLLFPCMGTAALQGYGEARRVEGSREGEVRLREREEAVEGVLPLEMAWAPETIMRSLSVSLGEGEQAKMEAEGAKGELELGKTFIWEDCYHM